MPTLDELAYNQNATPLSLAPSGGGNIASSNSLFSGGAGISGSTFSLAAGAVSDLFSADAYRMKGQGAAYEQRNYQLAATLADQNAQYTEWSTKIKEAQAARDLSKSMGETEETVAAAGFGRSGSALDILRESATQGALVQSVIAEQGRITAAGFTEQAASYRNMAAAAQVAIDADNKAADAAGITGTLKGAAAGATAGSIFGPVGMAVGAVAGAGAGLLASK